MLGSLKEMKLEQIEQGNLRAMIASYLMRKHSEVVTISAQLLSNSIEYLTIWSRVRFLCGSDFQTASSELPFSESGDCRVIRPAWYVSVEMNTTENSADVYYGKIQRLIEFDLQNHQHSHLTLYNGKYSVALIKWAESLLKGTQGQVYKIRDRFQYVDDRRCYDHSPTNWRGRELRSTSQLIGSSFRCSSTTSNIIH